MFIFLTSASDVKKQLKHLLDLLNQVSSALNVLFTLIGGNSMPLLYKGGDYDMFPCQQGCYNKINSGKKATVFQIEMLCAN